MWGEQAPRLAVSEARESLSEGPCDDAGEHLPKAWAEVPEVSEVSGLRYSFVAAMLDAAFRRFEGSVVI
jgi:hypothetical protein